MNARQCVLDIAWEIPKQAADGTVHCAFCSRALPDVGHAERHIRSKAHQRGVEGAL